MSSQRRLAMIFGLAAIVLTSACSHVNVPVQVTRPAEINLSQYKKIAVGPFQGKRDVPSNVFEALVLAVQTLGDAAKSSNQAFQNSWQGQKDDGSDVAQNVFNSLTQTGRFSMIDFSVIPNARASGDAVLMVSGTVADKEFSSRVTSEQKKTKEGAPYTRFTRSSEAIYNVNIKLVDISTGAIYLSRRYPCRRSTSTTQNDKRPSKLGSREIHELYDECKGEIAGAFAKAVAPYTETVFAAFAKIEESPATEAGISHAKVGNWDAAIASFETVPATQSMAEPEVQAKTWWNLGLAYEYNFQFGKAQEMVQKAYGLYPDSRYQMEMHSIGLLQKNQEKLKQQEYKGDEAAVPAGS